MGFTLPCVTLMTLVFAALQSANAAGNRMGKLGGCVHDYDAFSVDSVSARAHDSPSTAAAKNPCTDASSPFGKGSEKYSILFVAGAFELEV